MATVHNNVLDGALNVLATATRVDACSSEPTTLAQATTTFSLGNYTLTAGAGNGDWSLADGDTSGRKASLSAQTGNDGTATGVANWLAFTNGSIVLLTIPADGETINNGAAFSIAALNVYEIRDPS